MEYPSRRHTHMHRRDHENNNNNNRKDFPLPRFDFDNYPLPPRPGFDKPEYPPPRPAYDQPPPPYLGEVETHHSHCPHSPSFLHYHTHESSVSNLCNKPTFKVYCKADPNFHLTIRDEKVVLAPSDPNDPYQNWYKDEKYSRRVKDEQGFPCFALINKTTAQAMKHSTGASPVQLVPYNADVLDQSILWSEGRDLGDGYRAVRMVNNIKLNVDACQGIKEWGGVRDGTTIVLWEWNKGDNQLWRITPH